MRMAVAIDIPMTTRGFRPRDAMPPCRLLLLNEPRWNVTGAGCCCSVRVACSLRRKYLHGTGFGPIYYFGPIFFVDFELADKPIDYVQQQMH